MAERGPEKQYSSKVRGHRKNIWAVSLDPMKYEDLVYLQLLSDQ
jgi:hypothetical protein